MIHLAIVAALLLGTIADAAARGGRGHHGHGHGRGVYGTTSLYTPNENQFCGASAETLTTPLRRLR